MQHFFGKKSILNSITSLALVGVYFISYYTGLSIGNHINKGNLN